MTQEKNWGGCLPLKGRGGHEGPPKGKILLQERGEEADQESGGG